MCWKDDCGWVGTGLAADRAIRGGECRRKTGFPSPGASLPGVAGLTHRAWSLALLAQPGAQNPEPGAQPSSPSTFCSPTLPSLPQYPVLGEMGSCETKMHPP